MAAEITLMFGVKSIFIILASIYVAMHKDLLIKICINIYTNA